MRALRRIGITLCVSTAVSAIAVFSIEKVSDRNVPASTFLAIPFSSAAAVEVVIAYQRRRRDYSKTSPDELREVVTEAVDSAISNSFPDAIAVELSDPQLAQLGESIARFSASFGATANPPVSANSSVPRSSLLEEEEDLWGSPKSTSQVEEEWSSLP